MIDDFIMCTQVCVGIITVSARLFEYVQKNQGAQVYSQVGINKWHLLKSPPKCAYYLMVFAEEHSRLE